jgi:hypothetical protein
MPVIGRNLLYFEDGFASFKPPAVEQWAVTHFCALKTLNIWSRWHATDTAVCGLQGFCCSEVPCFHMLWQLSVERSGGWNMNCSHTATVQTVPSDYRMFGPMTEALRRWTFADDVGVKDVAPKWLWSQLKYFLHKWDQSRVDCYIMCIERKGWLCSEITELKLIADSRTLSN